MPLLRQRAGDVPVIFAREIAQVLNRFRTLKSASLAAGALLIAGLGASAFAEDRPSGDDRVVHRIIIKKSGKGGERIRINGKELSELRARCASGSKQEADVSSGEGEEKFRTRIIVCGDDKHAVSAVQREKLAGALERARSQLKDEDMLSAEGKAKAVEALEREIARLRSSGR